MTSSENSSFQNENESSEKGDTDINLFSSSSYQNEKEGSQRGSLKSYQNSEISQDKHEMSEERQNNQNSNISSGSEGLNKGPFNEDSFIEEKKNQEDLNYSLYGDNYLILKEITIVLIINNNKENKIKYEKVIYYGIEISYEIFVEISQEELKKQFELDGYNILFENKEKIIKHLNNIKEIANNLFKNIENKLIKFLEYKNNTDEYNNIKNTE